MKNPLPIGTYPYYDELPRKSKGLLKVFYKLLPIPLHIFYPLRQEIYLALIRLISIGARNRFRNQKDLLVNIGSGANGKPGWVNIDMIKAQGVNCLYDCRKSLPFPDDAVKAIVDYMVSQSK